MLKLMEKSMMSIQNKQLNVLNEEIEDIKKRNVKAKNELVSIISEILAKYSAENQIKLVLNKESIILGIKTIDITNEILTLLDKKVKNIKF